MKESEKRILEEAAQRFREGKTTFQEYGAATDFRWRTLADWLLSKWRAPTWFSAEDVLQCLHMGAWLGVWEYDPAYHRGSDGVTSRTLHDHIEFTAIDKAKKLLHKARGANLHGNADGELGNIDVAFSTMFEDSRGVEQYLGGESPEDDVGVYLYEHCSGPEEGVIMRAIGQAGNFGEGVDGLFESRALEGFGVSSRRDVERRAEQVAIRVVSRFG